MFDQAMEQAVTARGAGAARETWQFRARPHGVTGYSAVLDAASRCTVTDVAGAITTTLFMVDPDGEQFFPGQSAELATLVPNSMFASITEDERASYYCQPAARELIA